MARRPLNGNPRISCDNACHLSRGSAGGTDYAVVVGTPVYAPFAGKVVRQIHPLSGWRIGVLAPNGHDFWGFHLSGWVAATGAQVSEGQLIAYSGGAVGHPGAGSSTGPHLHAHVSVRGVIWGMEEYLASPAGGGGNAITNPKGKSMTTLFKQNNANRWALAGDSPGTPANWQESTSASFAASLEKVHGPAVDVTPESFTNRRAWYQQPLNTASNATVAIDYEALAEALAGVITTAPSATEVAQAVETALSDDFAEIPTAEENGQAARDAIIKD